jgi:hypothetical protein
MALARRMAADTGVDRLCWEITDHPESAFSRRFAPGTAEWQAIRHEIWDDNNLGNAIPGGTPRARIDVRGGPPGMPLEAGRRAAMDIPLRIRNLSQRAFPATASYGRRLVRVGAQLADRDGSLLDRDYARAALPHTLDPGAWIDVPFFLTAPDRPGEYTLRFDLVSEGIDWFERCGSEVTVRDLRVE